MPRTPSAPTDAELDVLKVLWDGGPATIRALTDRLYPDGGTAYYATVQKLLERLEGKGCVRRDRRDRVHVYRASVERADLISRRLRETARDLCAGSMTPLLTHLVEGADLAPEDLRRLGDLVERRARGRKA